jgi:hypothetical protein
METDIHETKIAGARKIEIKARQDDWVRVVICASLNKAPPAYHAFPASIVQWSSSKAKTA